MVFTGTFDDFDFSVKTVKFSCKNPIFTGKFDDFCRKI